jgi:hypothetical protein
MDIVIAVEIVLIVLIIAFASMRKAVTNKASDFKVIKLIQLWAAIGLIACFLIVLIFIER